MDGDGDGDLETFFSMWTFKFVCWIFFSMYLRRKKTCIHVLSIKNDEKLIFHD